MNVRDSELDRLLAEWLEDDSFVSPAAPVEAAVNHARTHPRRRDWLAVLRRNAMTTHPTTGLRPVVILVAIAAVLVLAVGGGVLIGSRPAPVEPSPTPVASPSASLAPSATEHLSDLAGLPLTFSVPPGWQTGTGSGGTWAFLREGLRITEIGFYRVNNLYVDPCDPALGWRTPPLGPTSENLVTALTDLPTYAEATVTPTEVDGYPATQIEVAESPVRPCEDDVGMNYYGQRGSAARDSVVGFLALGQYPDVWIVDVDGERLLIVRYGHADLFDELDGILASLRIGPS